MRPANWHPAIQPPTLWRKLLLASFGALAVGVFALLVLRAPQTAFPFLCLILSVLLVYYVRSVGRIARFAERLGDAGSHPQSASPLARLRAAVETAELRLRALDDRLDQRHGVTGLPTREPLLARMSEDGEGTLGVIAFVDFDRLCAFDPELADRALEQFAERILRMVGRKRMLAHVDRSHFVIWFGKDEPAADAEAQLGAISYALKEVLRTEGNDLVPEARVLHTPYSAAAGPPQVALSRLLAGCATESAGPAPAGRLHQLSSAGERDRYAFEQDLRNALPQGELELRFQPQVDAASGRVLGAEALLRWNSPSRGMVQPGLFVPLLESAGLIDQVGLWVLNSACREARLWQLIEPRGLSVAVNVSSQQLDCTDLHKRVERTLETHALPARALEIELTESAAAADVARAARLFEQLRRSGVRTALDDFGTGFSSLSALRALAFDKIKIDREFVTEVERQRDSQAICQSIIALARGLGIPVIAEGVERQEEYIWLRQHGCSQFQGFYFAPPLTAGEFQSFLSKGDELRTRLVLDPRHMQQTIAERLAL